MEYTRILILTALKMASMFIPCLILMVLICAAITKITGNKSWITKGIHKVLSD